MPTTTNYDFEPEASERERDTIVVEDELLREGFTQVPNLLLKRPDLSHGAKIAYALLLSYAWQQDRCFPGQDALAADMGVERKAVIRYLQELKAKDVIRVKRRGMGKTNVYFLPRLTDVPFLGHQDVPVPGHQEVRSVGHKEYSGKNTQREEDNTSKFERSHDGVDKSVDGGGKLRTLAESPTLPEANLPPPSTPSRVNGSAPAGFAALGDILQQRQQGRAAPRLSTSKPEPQPVNPVPRAMRGRQTFGTTEEREKLQSYLRDFCPELGDEAKLAASITQVLKIFRTGHIPIEHWDDHLYRARALTQEHTATITKQGSTDSVRRKNKFPYFKAVLEDLCGLREQAAPIASGTA